MSKVFGTFGIGKQRYMIERAMPLAIRLMKIQGIGGEKLTDFIRIYTDSLSFNAYLGRGWRRQKGLDRIDLHYINEQVKNEEKALDFKEKQASYGININSMESCRAYETYKEEDKPKMDVVA